MNPIRAWRATCLNRWHDNTNHALRNSGDTNAAHTGRCAVLCMAIFPGDVDTLQSVVIHDLGESGHNGGPGDMNGEVKRRFPDVASALQKMEEDALALIDAPEFALWTPRVKLLDKLDAYMFAMSVAPHLAQRGEWIAARYRIEEMARDLGVSNSVAECLA